MNKLYTLLIIVFLTGCSNQLSSYRSTSNAFVYGCKLDTITANLTSTDTTTTITATCVKEK